MAFSVAVRNRRASRDLAHSKLRLGCGGAREGVAHLRHSRLGLARADTDRRTRDKHVVISLSFLPYLVKT